LLEPGHRQLIPTGIAIALPQGYVGLVHPRSGLALRHGLSIVNAPGTIDAGYRGEISVLVINHDLHASVTIARGDRIAQLVIQQVVDATLVEVSSLPGSHRGAGGYGSTGGFTDSVTPQEEV
jgi:dUTP pyrophosphatase